MTTKIKLANVRCAFLVLGEPEFFGGKKEKPTDKRRWSATFLIPNSSPYKKLIDDAIRAEIRAKWTQKADAMIANIMSDPKACCFTDGARKPDYDGYKDHWALASHRPEDKGRPLVFDTDKSPIYKPTNELYEGKAGRLFSGCFVNATVEIYTYETGSKGAGCGLLGIQRFREGPAFGGGSPPNPDEFEEIAEEGGEEESLS